MANLWFVPLEIVILNRFYGVTGGVSSKNVDDCCGGGQGPNSFQ